MPFYINLWSKRYIFRIECTSQQFSSFIILQGTPQGIMGDKADALLDKAKMFIVQNLQPFEIRPDCLKAGKFTGIL